MSMWGRVYTLYISIYGRRIIDVVPLGTDVRLEESIKRFLLYLGVAFSRRARFSLRSTILSQKWYCLSSPVNAK